MTKERQQQTDEVTTTTEEEANPAIEQEPAKPQEKNYKVIGTQPVLGCQPGGVFTATLPFKQEELLTEYGHIEVTNEQPGQQEGDPTAGSETTSPDDEATRKE